MKKRPALRHASAMSIGELMSKSMSSLDSKEGELYTRVYVFSLWNDVVGKTAAKYTKSVSLKGKKLFVELDSSVARNELSMLRNDIMLKINRKADRTLVEEIILR